MVAVEEDEVAEAMVFLLERAKLVVEGAGAVGVAALLAGRFERAAPGTTVVVAVRRQRRRRAAGRGRAPPREPGRPAAGAARLAARPARLAGAAARARRRATGANLLDVEHIREGFDLHVRETAVQLVLETRGPGARRAR